MSCAVATCERSDIKGRGMCGMHYQRARREGMVRICEVVGCSRGVECHGFCPTHLWRYQHNGDPLKLVRYDRTCYCGAPHYGHGFCRRHYELAKKFQRESRVCIVAGCTRKADPSRCRDMCGRCFRERKDKWDPTRPLPSDRLRYLIECRALERGVSVDTVRREVGLSGNTWRAGVWSERTIDRILTEHFGLHISHLYDLSEEDHELAS